MATLLAVNVGLPGDVRRRGQQVHAGYGVRPLVGDPVKMRHLLVCRDEGPVAHMFDGLVRLPREAYWACAGRRPHHQTWLHANGQSGG